MPLRDSETTAKKNRLANSSLTSKEIIILGFAVQGKYLDCLFWLKKENSTSWWQVFFSNCLLENKFGIKLKINKLT